MHIKIAERLRPYSHLPGTFLVLPGSSCRVQVFPALLKIDGLTGAIPTALVAVSFDISGPVKEFTAELDLEKGCLRVWGHSAKGYFRYRIVTLAGGKSIAIIFEKTPDKGINFSSEGVWKSNGTGPVHAGETLIFSSSPPKEILPAYPMPTIDRLSLGSHKSQDWELVRRRGDFADIFPLWHRLGQLLPLFEGGQSVGTLSLLGGCRQALAANAPEHILEPFEKLFLAGFEGILSPRLFDTDNQGIVAASFSEENQTSPLELLSRGAALIRTMFVQCNENIVHLLPSLPAEFHCGRLIDVACADAGTLNIEWTKKAVRCATFVATRSQALTFVFSTGEKHCRLRHSHKDRGVKYVSGAPIEMVAGQSYWFDNFER